MKTIQFKIYPAKDNLALFVKQRDLLNHFYWEVSIFAKRQQFLRKYRSITDKAARSDMRYCEAIVCPRPTYAYLNKNVCYMKPRLGYALFHRNWVDNEIIAHESVHLATHFIRIHRVSSLHLRREIYMREEVLAYTIGTCVNQFIRHLSCN